MPGPILIQIFASFVTGINCFRRLYSLFLFYFVLFVFSSLTKHHPIRLDNLQGEAHWSNRKVSAERSYDALQKWIFCAVLIFFNFCEQFCSVYVCLARSFDVFVESPNFNVEDLKKFLLIVCSTFFWCESHSLISYSYHGCNVGSSNFLF